jgi:hypothetical protein
VKLVAEYKPAPSVPQPSWKRPPQPKYVWDMEMPVVDEEEFASLVFEEATARAIEALPGKRGDFPCAEDAGSTVDAYACVWCPYNKTLPCHGISTEQVTAEMDAIREEMYG